MMKESNKMGVILDITGYGVQLTDYGYEKIKEAKKEEGARWYKEFVRNVKDSKEFRTDKTIVRLVENNLRDMESGAENVAPMFKHDVIVHYIDLESPIWKNIDFFDDRVIIESYEPAGFAERIVIEMYCCDCSEEEETEDV